MKPAARLRELVASDEIVVAPGAYDAASARLIQTVGFPAVYRTGFGAVASMFGFPDIDLVTMSEMATHARRIADAVTVPVIADADNGYGSVLNVFRTVREYESAGVAAIQIEDQASPKRCGHMTGHQLVTVEEMRGKICAALKARTDDDVMLIVRTDAISAEGFEKAITRANIYKAEGADAIFVEAPRTLDHLKAIPELVDGPVLINVAPKTERLPVKEYEEMGYKIAIYPLLALDAAYMAVRAKALELMTTGTTNEEEGIGLPFDELTDFLGLNDFRRLEAEFLSFEK